MYVCARVDCIFKALIAAVAQKLFASIRPPLFPSSPSAHASQTVVELLVERGAHIDAQDSVSGWTALMQATYYGHRAVVRWLVDSGANVNIQVSGLLAGD
jgi:hypothetical protein